MNATGATWLLAFSRAGSARYLSHLDTARALRRTLARAGVQLSLSQGMRPKPRLALGLPLPVGVEALFELAAAGVAEAGDERTLLPRLAAAAPPGLAIIAAERWNGALRLRPERAVYEGAVAVDTAGLQAAVDRFLARAACTVTRSKPDGERNVDVRRSIGQIVVEAGPWLGEDPRTRLGFVIRHRGDGAARPAELLAALAACGAPNPPTVDATGRPAFEHLLRIGVTYAGMKPLGPVEEWLENHGLSH